MCLNLSRTPLVSIACITYNHSSYIREALDSFLMQKVSFPIEIIIHDDASTDGTDQIIKEYELKYPEVIVPIYQKENQYSKGIRRILATFVFPKCRGKYIALCEGDDYWTDSLKLQKQVAFLDSYPECSLCFHPVIQEFGLGKNLIFPSLPCKERYTLEDLLDRDFIPTCSSMFRNGLVREFPDWYFQMSSGDYQLFIFLAQLGMIGGIDEVMAVYRVHPGGVWSGLNTIMKLRTTIKHLWAINEHLEFQYHSILERKISYYYFQLSRAYCDEFMRRDALECLYKSVRLEYPNRTISAKEIIKLLLKLFVPGVVKASRYFRRGVPRR